MLIKGKKKGKWKEKKIDWKINIKKKPPTDIRSVLKNIETQDEIIWIYIHGVTVMIVGNGHCDTSSNPGWGWRHFK